MFGNKKVNELQEELEQVKKDYEMLLDKINKCDGIDDIVNYDYKGLISFDQNYIEVEKILKSDVDGINYLINLNKNGICLKSFNLYTDNTEKIISPLLNKKRLLDYELIDSIAKYISGQLNLYIKKMKSNCSVKITGNIPDELKNLFERSE